MKQYPLIKNNITREDLDKVIEHLQNDDPILTNGPKCRQFEDAWSRWLGVKYSLFVSSGSAANLLSMAILKIKHPNGGEVIVPPLTWVSDITSVLQNGFTPVFCDINTRTLGMDTSEVISKISDKTVAVFLTHVQGFNGLDDKLISELESKNIPLIEDVCESHGATYNNRKLGSFGSISNFSFYYAHHMSTIEGGMVCTNDEATYQNLRMLRSHGMLREASSDDIQSDYHNKFPDLNPDFIFVHSGYNLRNTEIGAIIGLNQLLRLDDMIEKRTKNQTLFLSLINQDHFQTDFLTEGSSNYAFNLILKNSDDELFGRLEKKLQSSGIEYRKGSAGGGNQIRQPYLRKVFPNINPTDYPNTEHVHFYGMYIGNFPGLNKIQISEICSVINSCIKN
jgi:CDP-4-dehydro-6-deoxyglucose reductase, E1